MGKPWEKYQNVAQTQGPWTKYQDKSGTTSNYLNSLDVENKMPDFLSWKDRAILKNFSNSPNASIKYLQMKYPDKQFRLEGDEVLARASNADKWGRLDPQPGLDMETLKDLPMDALDVAYDIPAGVAQGVATTLGAGAGLASPVPGGAMMGGMAASGGSAAALEATRQGLGKLAGIPQDIDGKQVLTSGVIGAAAPAVFGVGKGVGLDQPVKGALGHIWDYTGAPTKRFLQSKATGIPYKDIKTYEDNIPSMLEYKSGGLTPYLNDIGERANKGLDAAQSKYGQAVAGAINGAGGQIDTTAAREAYQQAKKALDYQTYPNDEVKAGLEKIVKDYESIFYKGGNELPVQMSPETAFDLQKSLKGKAKFYNASLPNNPNAAEQANAARSAYSGLNKAFSEATDSASQQAKDQYSKFMGVSDSLPDFEDPQKIYNTFSKIDQPGKVVTKEAINNLATDGIVDLRPDVAKVKAYNSFYGGETGRKAPLAAGMGSIGSLIGYKVGGGYSGAATGGALGAAAGTALGSPEALAKYLQLEGAASNASQYAKPYLAPAINQWMLLKQQQDEAQQAP